MSPKRCEEFCFDVPSDDPWLDPWYRFHRIIKLFEEHLKKKPSPESSWLDCGCHQGQFLTILARKYGIRGTGIDDWEPTQDYKHFDYIQSDLQKGFHLPAKFDFISAFETLEHMIDTDKFLRCCKEHLKKDGLLLLTTPNINNLRNRVTGIFGKYPVGLEYRTVIHHVRLYNCPTLKAHLYEHGFETVKFIGVSFLPHRLLPNRSIRCLSEILANRFPTLCNNMIVLATPKS